ncbi:hypothetical protein H1R20_g11797, partial [Candolleomyces eurysporus]
MASPEILAALRAAQQAAVAQQAAAAIAQQAAVVKQWNQNGFSTDTKYEFVDTAIEHINTLEDLEEKLSGVGSAARAVDATLDGIAQTFQSPDLAAAWSFQVGLELMGFGIQSLTFKGRWEDLLKLSCKVGNDTKDVLRRFDQVYLDKVENIQTDEDRLEAIKALGEFTNESQDRSDEMSRSLLEFKRAVAHFVERFGGWVASKGLVPSLTANVLKTQINNLLAQIEEFDRKIREAKESLAIAGSALLFIGMRAFPNVVQVLQAQREAKVKELRDAQQSLRNLEQHGILRLLAKLDSWKPELQLLCQQLIFFSEIWSCVSFSF